MIISIDLSDNENEMVPAIRIAMRKIEELINQKNRVQNPLELEQLEKQIVELTDEFASAIIGFKVQQSLDSPELQVQAGALAKSYPQKVKNQGPREHSIRPLRGPTRRVRTRYGTRKGKKQGIEKRSGFYPALILLGIYDHCTPALANEITLTCSLTASFAEAIKVLAQRNLPFDKDTLRLISYRYAARVRSFQRNNRLLMGNLANQRIVISVDGGRIRLREKLEDKKGAKGGLCYRRLVMGS